MAAIRIRMYRQGLGDSFLLTFPGGEHVLIDSGVLLGTADAETKMKAVASNVVEETGGKLDVLVATHEHWDHLSGFVQAQDVFAKLDIGEVWLAWTEDPVDELAQELRAHKKRALNAVAAAANHLAGGDPDARASAEQLQGLLGFFGDQAAAGGGSTDAALEWVKGRKAKVRYLRPGDLLPALGLRVFVLGPPHDRALIKRSDPSKAHPEVYELANTGPSLGLITALEALKSKDETWRQPFASFYKLGEEDAKEEPLFNACYDSPELDWRTIEYDWLGGAGPLALKLDSDTNNTSLVLAFETAPDGPVLLFPGDAQVGNWLSWETVEFADAKDLTSADLLARTVLYKVGHHASHNATLREKGLELMTSRDLTALIPVNREMAKKKKWNMPFPPLFKRLEEKTMGRILDAEKGQIGTKPDSLTEKQWKDFLARCDVQPGWIDYTVDVP
jgi:beta-lactamase superfamily II metal-dependent hydrolase